MLEKGEKGVGGEDTRVHMWVERGMTELNSDEEKE